LFKVGLLEVVGGGNELAEEVVGSGGDDTDDVGGIIPFEISFLLDFRFDEKIGMINSNL
jgi:hypothetical protein